MTMIRGAVAWRLVQWGQAMLTVGGAWLVWHGTGSGLWALVWALGGLLLPAWLLAWQQVWAAALNREDRLALRVRWRAWVAEVGWNVRVFGWQQPWRASACPDTTEPSERRGVLLVHGHLCTRAFWLPWLRRLQAEGVPFATVELWPPSQHPDAAAPALEAALCRLTALTGGRAPVVLAHSKGGLNVRAWRRWAAQRGDPAPERRVHALITVGTPHRGTQLAGGVPGRLARDLRPGSAWLAALARSEPADWRRRIGCVASRADAVVYPSSLALLEGTGQCRVTSSAHLELAFSPPVLRWVLAAVRGPEDRLPW